MSEIVVFAVIWRIVLKILVSPVQIWFWPLQKALYFNEIRGFFRYGAVLSEISMRQICAKALSEICLEASGEELMMVRPSDELSLPL